MPQYVRVRMPVRGAEFDETISVVASPQAKSPNTSSAPEHPLNAKPQTLIKPFALCRDSGLFEDLHLDSEFLKLAAWSP